MALQTSLPARHKEHQSDMHDQWQATYFAPRTAPTADHRSPKIEIEQHPHYVAVVVDKHGRMSLRSSHSLRKSKKDILADAMTKVRSALIQPMEPSEDAHALKRSFTDRASSVDQYETDAAFAVSKRPRVGRAGSDATVELNESLYRTESSTAVIPRPVALPLSHRESSTKPTIQLRADDTEGWRRWFADAFKATQQQVCRLIAKEWIKAIHPKKQSTHPYNGNIPRNNGVAASPERTKPPYWPKHVLHKEPDHIDKSNRVALLVHLLMATPIRELVADDSSEKVFTAKDLKVVLAKKQDEGMMKKWRIICTMIEARDFLENYEQDVYDGESTMDVRDYAAETSRSNAARRRATDTRASTPQEKDEDSEDDLEDNTDEDSSKHAPAPAPAPAATALPTTTCSHAKNPEIRDGNPIMPSSRCSASQESNHSKDQQPIGWHNREYEIVATGLTDFDLTHPPRHPPTQMSAELCPMGFYGVHVPTSQPQFSVPSWDEPLSDQTPSFDRSFDRNMGISHHTTVMARNGFDNHLQQSLSSSVLQAMMGSDDIYPVPYVQHAGMDSRTIGLPLGHMRMQDASTHQHHPNIHLFGGGDMYYPMPRATR